MKIKIRLFSLILAAGLMLCLCACSQTTEDKINAALRRGNPVAVIEIEKYGTVYAELYADEAPNTVANFVELAESGYYDGVTFYRISPEKFVQTGSPDGSSTGGPDYTIPGEFEENGFKNDIKHERGTLSMARKRSSYDSAGSQFFICLSEQESFDGAYATFGKVLSGISVLDQIGNLRATADNDGTYRPTYEPVVAAITIMRDGIELEEVQKLAVSE